MAAAVALGLACLAPVTPIRDGRLTTDLDANGKKILNLDTSNLLIGGGGGGASLPPLAGNGGKILTVTPDGLNIYWGPANTFSGLFTDLNFAGGNLNTLLGTPTVRGINKQVWIALRTDSVAGTGTPEDPFDGSGSNGAKLTAIISNASNTIFHYAPGTYTMQGWLFATRKTAGSGCKHYGAGIDRTVIQLVGASNGPGDGVLFGSDSTDRADGFELHDMTLDCNATAQPKWTNSNGAFVTGIFTLGSNINVSRVRVKNFGTKGSTTECFPIFIASIGVAGTFAHNVVEECIVDSPATGNANVVSPISVGGFWSSGVSPVLYDNVARNNYIDLTGNDFTESHGCFAQIVDGNFIKGVTIGFYNEPSGLCDPVIVRNNTFQNCFRSVISSAHPGSTAYRMTVTGNTSIDSGGYDFSSDDGLEHYREIVVSDNRTVRSDGVLITDTGPIFIDSAKRVVVHGNISDYNKLAGGAINITATSATVGENRTPDGTLLTYTLNGVAAAQAREVGELSASEQPSDLGDALRLAVTTTAPGGYVSYSFANSFVIAAGDKLQYEVYCDDLNVAYVPYTVLFTSGDVPIGLNSIVDQNGVVGYDNIGPFSKGRWYARTLNLGGEAGTTAAKLIVGIANATPLAVDIPAGNHKYYFRKIQVVDSNGNPKARYFTQESSVTPAGPFSQSNSSNYSIGATNPLIFGGKLLTLGANLSTTGTAPVTFALPSSGTPTYTFPSASATIVGSIGGVINNSSATWTVGSGSPEGVIPATVGSIYSRTNGGVGTTGYIKQSGTGNTGWGEITTAPTNVPAGGTTGQILTKNSNTDYDYNWADDAGGGGGGSGTVTTFSAGNLSPLFTSSVANATTTPALTFTLSSAGAHQFLGNNTGSTASPAYVQPSFTDLAGSLATAQLPALTGDVTSSAGSASTTIANGAVTLGKMANLAANSVIANNTGSVAAPVARAFTDFKADLALSNVENVALSTWTGAPTITTLGTIASGSIPASLVSPNPQNASNLTSGTLASDRIADVSLPLSKLNVIQSSVAETPTISISVGTRVQTTVSGTATAITFTGTMLAGMAPTTLSVTVTGGPYTLTIPDSYFVGETGSVIHGTSKVIHNGPHEISWQKKPDGNIWMVDSIPSSMSANSRLLGSSATGVGLPASEITLGTNLSMTGNTLNASVGSVSTTPNLLKGDDLGGIADSGILPGNVPLLDGTNAFTNTNSITVSTNAKAFPLVLKNVSNGTVAVDVISLWNDQNIGTRSLDIGYTSSAFSGAALSGGPTGEVGYIATTGAKPLLIGANNSPRIIVGDGTTISGIVIGQSAGTNPGSNNLRIDGGVLFGGVGVDLNLSANASATNNVRLTPGSSGNVSFDTGRVVKWNNGTGIKSNSGVLEGRTAADDGYVQSKWGFRDTGTNTVVPGLTVNRGTSGTPALGFGAAIAFTADSATSADQDIGQIRAAWKTATTASRTSYVGVQSVGKAQTLTDRQIIGTSINVATNNVALPLFDVVLPTLKGCAGTVTYRVFWADATRAQCRSGIARYSGVNVGGTYTREVAVVSEGVSASTGTLTATPTWTTGVNLLRFNITANSSLTSPVSYYVEYSIQNLSESTITVL